MISVLSDILENPHKCDSGVSSLEQIWTCINEYTRLSDLFYEPSPEISYEASGIRVTDLKSIFDMHGSDMLYIARDKTGLRITYDDLVDSLQTDILCSLGVGSMAFESKYKYSKIDHNHDGQYTMFDLSCAQFENKTIIGTFSIGRPGDEDGNSAKFLRLYVPKAEIKELPHPEIGTVKFMYLKTGEMRPSNQELIQSDDFDGWLYADGSILTNVNPQRFKDAISKFGNGTNFTVPNLSGFFKMNGGMISKINQVHPGSLSHPPRHRHLVDETTVTGRITSENQSLPTYTDPFRANTNKSQIHHGYASKESKNNNFTANLNNVSFPDLTLLPSPTNVGKFHPAYQKIYAMVYIGGTLETQHGYGSNQYIDFIVRSIDGKFKTYATYIINKDGLFKEPDTEQPIEFLTYPEIENIEGYNILWSDESLRNASPDRIRKSVFSDYTISAKYVFDSSYEHTIVVDDNTIVIDEEGNEIDASDFRLINMDIPETLDAEECFAQNADLDYIADKIKTLGNVDDSEIPNHFYIRI